VLRKIVGGVGGNISAYVEVEEFGASSHGGGIKRVPGPGAFFPAVLSGKIEKFRHTRSIAAIIAPTA